MDERERQQLTTDLIRDEAIRLKPYRCTAGKLTIGVGRNLEDVGISEAEARYLANNDITRVLAELDREIPWWRGLSERRRIALANMVFNMGIARVRGFKKLLAALQAGHWERAKAEALDSQWARQVGDRAVRIAQAFLEG